MITDTVPLGLRTIVVSAAPSDWNIATSVLTGPAAVVAAVWTCIHIVLGVVAPMVNDFWGYGLLVLFVVALILAFVRFSEERVELTAWGCQRRWPVRYVGRAAHAELPVQARAAASVV